MKAMIFAAGLGTRLKPLTDSLPKALVPIGGKTLLEHVIIKLKENDFTEIIINVHHFPNQIINFLKSKNNFDIRIEISDEREQLLDTGGAIKKAAWFFDDAEAFLIHNVDILSNVNLKEFYLDHCESKAAASLLVSKRETERYLLFDKQMRLHAWTNIKTGEIRPDNRIDTSQMQKLAFSGIHVVSSSLLKLMENYDSKFSIIDFYLNSAKSENIKGFTKEEVQLLDVGKLHVLDLAENFIKGE